MEVYLIRHAETGGNVAHRHQALHTALTPRGKTQAIALAESIEKVEPTHLVSSPLVRALQTAQIIGERCNLIPETSTFFTELDRPPHLYGHFHASPQSVLFYLRWYFGQTKVGESYEAVRQRIEFAKSFFAQYPEDARIAVVSHSVFINLFLAHMCDTRPIGPLTALKTFSGILTIKNTDLIPLVYNPEAYSDTCGWYRVDA